MTPVVSKELLIRFPRAFIELFRLWWRPVAPDAGKVRPLPSPLPITAPGPSLICLFLSTGGVSLTESSIHESKILVFILLLVFGFKLDGNLNS
jgi:hypothetical protein